MASNFAGGFARGFEKSFVADRERRKDLEDDLFKDQWTRFNSSLDERRKKIELEKQWVETASMFAQSEGEQKIYENLLQNGVKPDELGDYIKKYKVVSNQPVNKAPTPTTDLIPDEMKDEAVTPPQSFAESSRGLFSSIRDRQTSAVRNRGVKEISKRTKMDEKEVQEILYGSSVDKPSDLLDFRLVPRTSYDVEILKTVTPDNYKAMVAAAIRSGDEDMANRIDKIGQYETSVREDEAKKADPYKTVPAMYTMKDGSVRQGKIKDNGTFIKYTNEDGTETAPVHRSGIRPDVHILSEEANDLTSTERSKLVKQYTGDTTERFIGYSNSLDVAEKILEVGKMAPDDFTKVAEMMDSVRSFMRNADVLAGVVSKAADPSVDVSTFTDWYETSLNKASSLTGQPLGRYARQLLIYEADFAFNHLRTLGQTGAAVNNAERLIYTGVISNDIDKTKENLFGLLDLQKKSYSTSHRVSLDQAGPDARYLSELYRGGPEIYLNSMLGEKQKKIIGSQYDPVKVGKDVSELKKMVSGQRVGSSPYSEGTILQKNGQKYIVKGGVPVLQEGK